MGRPTTHYLSTLPSHHSSTAHSSTSTSRRSRSSSPRPARIHSSSSSSSSSPSPRKPRPSFLPIDNLPSPSEPPRGWVDEWFLTKEEWNAHPLNKERSPIPRPRRRRHRRWELSSEDADDQDQHDAALLYLQDEEHSSPRATRRRRGPLFGNPESLLMEDGAEGRVGAREQEGEEGGQDDDGNDLERMQGTQYRIPISQRDSILRMLGLMANEEEEDVQSPSPLPAEIQAELQVQAQRRAQAAALSTLRDLTMANLFSNWTPAAEL